MSIILFAPYDSKVYNDAVEIRKKVFVLEQKISERDEFDSKDRVSQFAVLYTRDKKAAACARLTFSGGEYKIGRIAVLYEFRGRHYGAEIVNKVVEFACKSGAERVFVDAQLHAVPFYQKLGFTLLGGEIIDRGIIHMPMCKTI